MKPGNNRRQAALPKLPQNYLAFSSEFWVHSRKSWNRFVGMLVIQKEQAFQIILEADDEVSARDAAMKHVREQIAPFLKRMTGNPRVWFECDSPIGLFLPFYNAYSVTFVAMVQRKIPKSK